MSKTDDIEKIKAQRKKELDYRNKYQKENYYRAVAMIPLSEKDNILNYIKEKGYKSFTSYVLELIKKDMQTK